MYVICVIKAKVGKYGFECVILKPQTVYYNNKTNEIDMWYGHVLFMDGSRIALRA
jgi:hypothetical protein